MDLWAKDSFVASRSYSGILSPSSTYFRQWWPESEAKWCDFQGCDLKLNLLQLLKWDSVMVCRVFMKSTFVVSSGESLPEGGSNLLESGCFLKSICSRVFLQLWDQRTVSGLCQALLCDFKHLGQIVDASIEYSSSFLTSPILRSNLALSIVDLLSRMSIWLYLGQQFVDVTGQLVTRRRQEFLDYLETVLKGENFLAPDGLSTLTLNDLQTLQRWAFYRGFTRLLRSYWRPAYDSIIKLLTTTRKNNLENTTFELFN